MPPPVIPHVRVTFFLNNIFFANNIIQQLAALQQQYAALPPLMSVRRRAPAPAPAPVSVSGIFFKLIFFS